MPLFAVEYTYTDDVPSRVEHRSAHRAYLGALVEAGALLGSGPYADTSPDGALIIVRAESVGAVEGLFDGDPFWVEGLVAARTVTQWDLIIGPWAAI